MKLKQLRLKLFQRVCLFSRNKIIIYKKSTLFQPKYGRIFLLQIILFEIDCAVFYTNLHELFWQFKSQTNWVNSEYHVKLWADMEIFYDDLIIIDL